MLKAGLYSLILRGATLISRFILMFTMVKYLNPTEVGVYGLMTVTIAISLYLVGMDFYVYNTRELLAKKECDRTKLIRDQLVFHGFAYLLVLPLLLVTFAVGFIPWRYIGWFYILLILEHLAQEANRLFITFSQPVLANAVLFLRTGLWVYAIAVVFIVFEEGRTLATIWLGWTSGVTSSLVLGIFFLCNLNWGLARAEPIDWAWIKRGVRVSMMFLCSSVAYDVGTYADRYFLQHYHGEAIVGVYTFYNSIANVIGTLVSTGIISIIFPKIIEAYHHNHLDKYKELM